MGNARKYFTEEEQKEAKRKHKRTHYKKHRDQELARARENYIKYKERITNNRENRRQLAQTDIKILISEMTSSAKSKAKRRGIEFELTKCDIEQLFINSKGRCALSGLPLDTTYHSKLKASVDRIDSTKGYSVDNIQLVATCVNVAKNSLTQEQFIAMCKAVVAFNS